APAAQPGAPRPAGPRQARPGPPRSRAHPRGSRRTEAREESVMMPRGVRIRLLSAAAVRAECFVALGGKAWTLQVDESPRLAQLGRQQYWRELVLPPP